jgi:two-component system, LytTR family, response regulator
MTGVEVPPPFVRRWRTVIVEDERPARTRLRSMLARFEDVEITGEADAVGAGAELIRTTRPDLLFLDIRLTGGTAFHLLQQLAEPLPVVVFVTAHADYAVRAFDVHAVDYLLKPVESDRLERCLERIRARRVRPEHVATRERLQQALQQALQPPSAIGEPLATEPRLVAQHDGRSVVVEPQLIDYIEGDRNYVWFHCGGARLRGRYTLNELATRLDPQQFSRAHRSLIVNLASVRSIERTERGGVQVTLLTGERVPCGDVYRRGLLDLLGLTRSGQDGARERSLDDVETREDRS